MGLFRRPPPQGYCSRKGSPGSRGWECYLDDVGRLGGCHLPSGWALACGGARGSLPAALSLRSVACLKGDVLYSRTSLLIRSKWESLQVPAPEAQSPHSLPLPLGNRKSVL